MAELSVAKSSSNLNISHQQFHLLKQSLVFGNKFTGVIKPHLRFILPNRKNWINDDNRMIDFAHT